MPLLPACRSEIGPNDFPHHAAMCVIAEEGKLLVVRHRLSGKLDLPGGRTIKGESAACTAHRETFEETGLNTNIIGVAGTISQTVIFACRQYSGFTPNDSMTVPDWGRFEVTDIQWVDPFTLTHDDWRFPEHHHALNDAFVKASQLLNQ